MKIIRLPLGNLYQILEIRGFELIDFGANWLIDIEYFLNKAVCQ